MLTRRVRQSDQFEKDIGKGLTQILIRQSQSEGNSLGTSIGKNPEYDAVLPYAGKETIQRILEIAKNQTDDTLFASVHTPGSHFSTCLQQSNEKFRCMW